MIPKLIAFQIVIYPETETVGEQVVAFGIDAEGRLWQRFILYQREDDDDQEWFLLDDNEQQLGRP
jgi:hypothetical protein